MNTGLGPKGFIIGGIVILTSAFAGQTFIPWYVKIIGGVLLIIYGTFKVIQPGKRDNNGR